MPTSANQRTKLLYLMKIMLEKTDEQNPLTTNEIISELASCDVQAKIKSIYTDFDLLRQFGIDIESQRSKTTSYYVAGRQFELPELKLLVDAVQSSRFITKKKSEELIKKLSSLTSNEQAKLLRRQVYVADRAKTLNETVYYNIDQIHYAINERKKNSFKYFDYDVNKSQVFRKHGTLYTATPVSLCWNDDNYYLITYNSYFGDFTHYRVARMISVTALSESGDKIDKGTFNIAEYTKRMFGMYGGDVVRARLSSDNTLAHVAIDRFGKDVQMQKAGEEWFDVLVEVSISPVFLSWIFTFGDKAMIKEPASLVEAMKELIKKNSQLYFRN